MKKKSLQNASTKGQIYYGLHFYSGIAQYQDGPDQEPYRVYLNEDTLRLMDPTFAGCPVFVEHVDEVDPDLDRLRGEADGWVVESFFNATDGKHWVKFIVNSEKADRAIQKGLRLSNAYVPKQFKPGGLYNGVPYTKEIIDAEYEHLAIVSNPRYEESIILTPDEFKEYNDKNLLELKKLSNSQSKGKTHMKFSFFKKTKMENAIDPELLVLLPSSGRTVSIAKLIQDADLRFKNKRNEYEKDQDEAMEKKQDSEEDESGVSAKKHAMADENHVVKMKDGSMMKVKDMKDALEKMKKDSAKKNKEMEEMDLEVSPHDVDAEGDLHNKECNDEDSEWEMDEHEEKVAQVEHEEEMKDDLEEHPEEVVHDEDDEDEEEDSMEDAEDPRDDEKAKEKALQLAEHEEKEIEEAKKKDSKKNKKKNELAKIKAQRLRNAHLRVLQNQAPAPVLELSADLVSRGRQRYGS